jgi:hypothetical protein
MKYFLLQWTGFYLLVLGCTESWVVIESVVLVVMGDYISDCLALLFDVPRGFSQERESER